MSPTPTITTEEWQAELDSLMADSMERIVPDGGFTIRDMMTRYGISRSKAVRRISEMVAAGKVEKLGIRPGVGREQVYGVKSLQDAPQDEN